MNSKSHSIQDKIKQENRFDFFFDQRVYLSLKKYFYNYRARQHAVIRHARDIKELAWLEVGAGVTPVLPADFNVTYSELSAGAVEELKILYPHKKSVACSATAISFDSDSFDGVVCSEVLEHIENDGQAVAEMARVLKHGARLLVTVPINPWMYSFDDAYVAHCRRYDPSGLIQLLQKNGFEKIQVYKISGLVDKLCLMLSVGGFRIYSTLFSKKKSTPLSIFCANLFLPFYIIVNWILFGIVWLESKLLPWSLCSVALAVAQKKKSDSARDIEHKAE